MIDLRDRLSASAQAGRGTSVRPVRRRTGGRLGLLLLFVLGGTLPAGAGEPVEDQEMFDGEIRRGDKQPYTRIKIIEDSWKFVVGRKARGKTPVPSFEVTEVVYTDSPREFRKGPGRVAQGSHTEAIEKSFKPMMKKLGDFRKVGGHPWPKQYCLYYLGLAHVERGDKKKDDAAKALKYFKRLINEIPASRFIMDAYLGVGNSHRLAGRYTEAAAAFNEAKKHAEKLSREPDLTIDQIKYMRRYARLADLRQADTFRKAGQAEKAVSLCDRVTSQARDYPDIRFLARSGAVMALVSLKSYDRAIRRAEDMIKEGEQEGLTEYLGGAYLALADCYFEKAGAENLVVARYNYLRVATLYFTEESVLPKARFRAGVCYEKLAKLPKIGEGPKSIARAKRQYRLVVDRFPDSPWAAKAEKRLAGLGEKRKPKGDEAVKKGGKKGTKKGAKKGGKKGRAKKKRKKR